MKDRQFAGLCGTLVALLVSGCGAQDPPPKKKDAGATSSAAAEQIAADATVGAAAPTPPPVQGPAPTLDAIGIQLAEAASLAMAEEASVTSDIDGEAGPDGAVIQLVREPGGLRFYGRDGALNKDGEALLEALANLERQGFDKKHYRLSEVDAATKAVRDALEAERNVLLALQTQQRASVVAASAALWLRGGEGGLVNLVRAGADQLDDNGRIALSAVITPLVDATKKSRVALVRADRELLRAAIHHIVDYQYAKRAHPLKFTEAEAVRQMAQSNAAAVAKILKEGQGNLAEAFKKLWPRHPQYALLLGAYDTYKKIADAGGWKPLPPWTATTLKSGDSGPLVVALRERLRAEGYACGDGEAFDDTLVKAVKTYQSRHQMDEDGVVNKTVWADLDLPVARRLAQIGLSLQRLRDSEARNAIDDGFFIWVNIAFQVLWVYDGGVPIARHKAVVGNNSSGTDQLTQMKGKVNRTKMFSHKMERIVLSPKWYPTPRVVELELQPKLAKDPAYLERGGYVREIRADGSESWYQRSGKGNLLGQVKFVGTNPYNIYLHDTPIREKFKVAWRAFSHGCVRVQNPLELADLLLGRDSEMTKEEIRSELRSGDERTINLKKPVPVHVDYASVAVDEQGVVVFGADIYGYDRAYFDGMLPVKETTRYAAGSTKGL